LRLDHDRSPPIDISCGIPQDVTVPPLDDLTPEERQAALELIEAAPSLTDDLLFDALGCSMQTRLENSRRGGLIIRALHRHLSWEDIAATLSERIDREVSASTIRGWIEPPRKERP
jgi:hypothetical protein